MITKKMTIAEAIKSNPDIIHILSDANIDYCCGGHRSLLEAAEEKNPDGFFRTGEGTRACGRTVKDTF